MSDEQNVGQRKCRGENVGGENVGWPDLKICVMILVAQNWVPDRPDESQTDLIRYMGNNCGEIFGLITLMA